MLDDLDIPIGQMLGSPCPKAAVIAAISDDNIGPDRTSSVKVLTQLGC
jgi:hypothetical protein